MKVLSIDFDYFQSADIETVRTAYPDPVDLSTPLSTMAWAAKYADPDLADLLNDVTINETELQLAKTLLNKQDRVCPAMVTNSHRCIYDFINANAEARGEDKLRITHIDMHDDMFNNNDILDCGNWITFLCKKYGENKIGVDWVANPISREQYGLDGEDFDDIIKTSICAVPDRKYDVVFLCRSDNWLPPHLDDYFDELLSTIVTHFDKPIIQDDITMPREYEKQSKAIRKELQRLKTRCNSRDER